MVKENISGPIDCACVIHGNAYTWEYVDRLYSMLRRHLTSEPILHVYTEKARPVPKPYVKHELYDWGIGGPKSSWWYKLQIFNTDQHAGPLLYFDLDTVIIRNIDWITRQPLDHFWTVRDFKYLWKPTNYSVNSSIMWFDTRNYAYVLEDFQARNLDQTLRTYHGDQDYINDTIGKQNIRFLDQEQIKSWRWQCLDGGYNFDRKFHLKPNTGTQVTDLASVLIFHGKPKPKDIIDPFIVQHWQ